MSWTQVSSGTGPTGAEGPEGPAGGTAGIVLYCDPNDASDLAGYKTALLVPSAAAETPVTVTVTSSGTYVAVGSFATDPGSPASLSLAAGQYAYSFFGTTNSSTNRARLKYELYTCAADGSSETLRRTSTSDTFYSATVMHVDDNFLDQTGYTTAVTDRLVLKVSAARVSGDASFPVNVYFCGNNNASHAHTSAVAKTIAVGIQTTSGPTTLDVTTIADGQYLKRSGSNVIGASTSTPTGFMSAIYGPGGMGDLTVATGTTTTLAKDSYYQNVTIQGTGQLRTAGWKLHVAGTLTISSAGSVHDDGNAASGNTPGGALTGGSSCRGLTGAGANGVVNTVAAGAAGSTSSAAALNNINALPTGGAGGTSGAQNGGAAGAATAANQGPWGNWLTGRGTSATAWTGGAGGGSGGCSTASLTNSGGGGGGGGVCWVAARSIISSAGGRISANGGLGGAPVGTGGASNPGVAGSTVVIGLGGT